MQRLEAGGLQSAMPGPCCAIGEAMQAQRNYGVQFPLLRAYMYIDQKGGGYLRR